MMLSL